MDYYRRVLIDYEKQVLENLPNPFGSFEKAKYTLCDYPNSVPVYSFITTTRNTEECIGIMQNIWDELRTEANKCIIYKIRNGVREIVFTNKIGYNAKGAILF